MASSWSNWLEKHPTAASLIVLLAAAGLALCGARDRVGGWNDSSRLALVESLVDHHTLAIDQSIFAQPQPQGQPLDPHLLPRGTSDKLFINGHYYSDKSPVPGLLLAGLYQGWKWTTGETARSWPS